MYTVRLWEVGARNDDYYEFVNLYEKDAQKIVQKFHNKEFLEVPYSNEVGPGAPCDEKDKVYLNLEHFAAVRMLKETVELVYNSKDQKRIVVK